MAKKASTPRQYHASAAVRELARLARNLRKIESTAEFLQNGKRITLSLCLENDELKTFFQLRTSLHQKDSVTLANTNTLQDELQRLLDQHLHAKLLPETVKVKTSTEGDLSPTRMLNLLQRVWSEACGIDPELATSPAKPSTLDFDAFMKIVEENADEGKLKRAVDMLKEEHFQLYAEINDTQLVGIVRSQKKTDFIYSCHLNSRGRYGCCTPVLAECWGMRGELCKHLLVLIVGLTKGGKINADTAAAWITAVGPKKPSLHEELLSDTLLMYKGAEAGEIDWRPTETIPEDYFAY